MQRLQGDGLAFVHAGGMLTEMQLAPGQTLRVDTGCLVALQPSVTYDVQLVGGVKTALFGGEGLFFATLTGPGHVWLQSLPLSRLADRIAKAIPGIGRGRKGEGSVLDVDRHRQRHRRGLVTIREVVAPVTDRLIREARLQAVPERGAPTTRRSPRGGAAPTRAPSSRSPCRRRRSWAA